MSERIYIKANGMKYRIHSGGGVGARSVKRAYEVYGGIKFIDHPRNYLFDNQDPYYKNCIDLYCQDSPEEYQQQGKILLND